MTKRKSEYIEVMGFYMTCIIVIYHCSCSALDALFTINWIDDCISYYFSQTIDTMAVLAMSHFFAVTGYLTFLNLNFENYPIKIKRRFFSLLLPYVAWQFIIWIKLILVSNYELSISAFLYRTFALVKWPLIGALWYVYVVFLLSLISPILLLVFKNKQVGLAFIIVALILIAGKDYLLPNFLLKICYYGVIENTISYLLSYLVGAFYGRFQNEWQGELSLKYVFYILFVALLMNSFFDGIFSYTALRLLPVLGLIVVPEIPVPTGKKIYRLSFLIYAIHSPLESDWFNRVYNFYSQFPIPATVANVMIRTTLLMMAILVAVVLYEILRRIAPVALKILMGGRGIPKSEKES